MTTSISVPLSTRTPARAPASTPGRPYAGWRSLLRLAARRDRIILPLWIYILAGSIASTAYSIKGLYPDQASRQALASATNSVFGVVAMYGPIQSPTLGAITAWKIGLIGAVLAAVMSILLVVRHTRAEEQAGRQELLGAAAVGRLAPLGSALALMAGADLAVGLVSAAALDFFTGSWFGALALGLAIGGTGVLFGALAALTAQLAESSRTANAIAAALLGAGYLVRAAADGGGPAWLSWASPLGWLEHLRPYAGDRWWVLALYPAGALILTAAAFRPAKSRDLGTGLLPVRAGAARAGRYLRGSTGLAWRLQCGSLTGWTVGYLIAGLTVGAIIKDIGHLMTSSAQADSVIERMGGQSSIVNAYLVVMGGFMGVLVGAYVIPAVLRARAEESSGHAELLLSGPVGRLRWMAAHLAIALLGSALLLTAYGTGLGLADGIRSHNVSGLFPQLLGAALAQWPAVAVLVGLAALVVGAAPRLAQLAWAPLVVFLLIGMIGQVLRLSQTVLDLSPFVAVPKLPGTAMNWAPLGWLTLLAAVLTGAGLAVLRRRDLDLH